MSRSIRISDRNSEELNRHLEALILVLSCLPPRPRHWLMLDFDRVVDLSDIKPDYWILKKIKEIITEANEVILDEIS